MKKEISNIWPPIQKVIFAARASALLHEEVRCNATGLTSKKKCECGGKLCVSYNNLLKHKVYHCQKCGRVYYQ